MTENQESKKEILLSFVKGSWDNILAEDTKKTFLVLAKQNEKMAVNKLSNEAVIDRTKINSCISALEALQLISYFNAGNAKIYELTELGVFFAEEKLNLKVEG